MDATKTHVAQKVAGVLILVVAAWYFLGGGMQKHTSANLQGIHDQVARDAVDRYEIAKRNGTEKDACFQAGLVAAAYLQAKDEANYKQWKRTEESDCARK